MCTIPFSSLPDLSADRQAADRRDFFLSHGLYYLDYASVREIFRELIGCDLPLQQLNYDLLLLNDYMFFSYLPIIADPQRGQVFQSGVACLADGSVAGTNTLNLLVDTEPCKKELILILSLMLIFQMSKFGSTTDKENVWGSLPQMRFSIRTVALDG